ncbi:MAG: D-cysteine desulfhydrase family protein [Actinomycetota bacterium]|nr:D-cysteine desulfhydrase family protein [Actinomycetota bacterium]
MNQSRIGLAHLPTPLEPADRLTAAWGGPTIWVKRDDLTGFGLSGNKIRKLEFHLAAALDAGTDTVITCGAVQSNHCRATALAAARVGLDTILYLRSPNGEPPETPTGNHLLHRLAGAECRFITPEEYDDRDRIMAEAAAARGRSWVIPEGASDPLGAQGFVAAMHEIAPQLEEHGIVRPIVWHAASSAGTTAGMIRGADELGLDVEIVGSSVGDPAGEVEHRIRLLLTEAITRFGGAPAKTPWRIVDDYIGRGYGLSTPDELAVQAEATRLTGMLFDPAYTGKTVFGLKREIEQGRFTADDNVIFWHTGGGFAVFADPAPPG